MTQPTAQDLLMGGGGRMFSWAIKQPTGHYATVPYGTFVSGVLESEPSVAQQTDINTGALLTWPDGKPKLQLIFTLQTQLREDPDDDGKRTLWVKQSSNLQAAIRDAVSKTGAQSAEAGGLLTATLVGERPASKGGQNPIKVFEVQYQRPAQQALMAPDGAQGQPAQQQFQQPPQQQFQGQPAQGVQQPAQAPAAGAPAAGPDPVQVAGQLAALKTMTAEQIATITGLPVEQVKARIPPY